MLDMQKPRPLAQLLAASFLLWSARKARIGQVSAAEERIFRALNNGPDRIESKVWAIMQFGSFAAIPAVALIVGLRHGRSKGSLVVAAGTAAWLCGKLVKSVVHRGRPDTCLAHVNIRGRPQAGYGYPSGHAGVALALALTAPSAGLSRTAAVAAAGATAGGRVYAGAHLPLDVVGGLAIGTIVASLAQEAQMRRRS